MIKQLYKRKCLHSSAHCHIRRILLTITFFVAPFISSQLDAQAIGNWTFNSTLAGTPGSFNTVSTADFSMAVPIHSYNGGTEYFGENGWPTGSANTSMYMQFSLTPVSGYQLDISSLVFTMRRSNTGSPAGSGPTSWVLRSSLDGFATDIATGSITLTYANYTITPGSAFINLYSTITFRLYGYNTTVSSGGNSRLVFDNIKVNGIGYLLPVRLGALTATTDDKKINLSYSVYNTEAGDRYIVERSTDGIGFSTLGAVTETGNTAEKNYTYTNDVDVLNGTEQLFYRIRLAGNSGAAAYSNTVKVKTNDRRLPVKINTSNKRLYITGMFKDAGTYRAAVYTGSGQLLTDKLFQATDGYNSVALDINQQKASILVIHLSNNKGYHLSSTIINKQARL